MQKSKSAQVKKINALFSSSREQQQPQRKSIDGSIESSSTYKYGIHRKRQSSIDSTLSSDLPFYYHFNVNKNSHSSTTPSSRRQSYTEGFQSTDGGNGRLRKKNSWNLNSSRNIEHPSAFPSLLRSDTPPISSKNYQNGHNNNNNNNGGFNKNDSYSISYNRQNGNTNATNLRRRASMSALVISKKHQQQKQQQENISNLFSYKDTPHMHGSNIYLRADSFGNLNLVRRDSMVTPRRDSSVPLDIRSSPPRDYVSSTLPKRKGSDSLSGRRSEERRPSSSMSISSLPTLNGRKSSADQIIHQPSCLINRRSTESPLREDILERHVRILDLNSDSDGNKYTTSSGPKRSSFSSSSNLGNANNGGSESNFYANRTRRMSTDSLDHQRRNSLGDEDDIDGVFTSRRKYSTSSDTKKNESDRPHFIAVTTLEDTQAIRCAEFHPNGKIYGVGSNTKTFRICEYPSLSQIGEDHVAHEPNIVFKKSKYHKGSIYCMSWAPDGELLATGSNDKTIKLMRYNETTNQLDGRETELTMHDGTIRDLCFLEDSTNKASLLISGGAGDCKIYVTDCGTATPFQALSGHSGHILSVYNWGGAMFVSGSQDKTIRFWDLRTRGCVNTITPATTAGTRLGSPVAAVCVDPSGRLLVSGHEDSSCVLYDIRGNRPIQCFKPHTAEIRSIRFSPSAYYLLTTGYDNKIVLSDLQGDLTLPLPSVTVAYHSDKVISGRWHPNDFSFITTSADKTAILWALPPS